jgi:hypothetical protein
MANLTKHTPISSFLIPHTLKGVVAAVVLVAVIIAFLIWLLLR